MGFLDHLWGDARTAEEGHESALAPMLLAVLGGGEGRSAEINGLTGLIDRFKQAGLGNIVQSWVSNDQVSAPVSPDQVHAALGDQHVAGLAEKSGLPTSAVLSALSTMLPKLVNAMTPNGAVPSTPDTGAVDRAGENAAGQTDRTAPDQSGTIRV